MAVYLFPKITSHSTKICLMKKKILYLLCTYVALNCMFSAGFSACKVINQVELNSLSVLRQKLFKDRKRGQDAWCKEYSHSLCCPFALGIAVYVSRFTSGHIFIITPPSESLTVTGPLHWCFYFYETVKQKASTPLLLWSIHPTQQAESWEHILWGTL